uniref:Uncharacterized protein n=1 Tax=mine drainage metagenome TaxID=410659 RepID=E6QQ81_9ZZZZ
MKHDTQAGYFNGVNRVRSLTWCCILQQRHARPIDESGILVRLRPSSMEGVWVPFGRHAAEGATFLVPTS